MKTIILILISCISWHNKPVKYEYKPRRCHDGITVSFQTKEEIIEDLCYEHGIKVFDTDLGHVLFLIERAKHYQVPERIAVRWIDKESGFDSVAVSCVGAYGYAQIMPGTWNELSCKLNFEYSAKNNIEAGLFYLSEQYKRFGRWDLALAAYNSGPFRPCLYQGRIPRIGETQKYVKYILK